MLAPEATPWEASKQITAARKAGKLVEAVELGREAWKRWPEESAVLQAIAWCLYERDIKPLDDDSPASMFNAAELTVRKVLDWPITKGNDPYDKWDPRPFLALKLAKAQMSAARFNQARSILQALSPARLSSTSDNSDFAPPRTKWFGMMTKCLKSLGAWEDLIALGQLPERASLVGKDVQWIEYRLAWAYLQQGRLEEALAGIDQALKGKRDAWVRILRGEVLFQMGRVDEAEVLVRSALAGTRGSDLRLHVKGVRLLSRVLSERDPKLSALHGRLLIGVFQENGWSVKADDLQLAAADGQEPVAATVADIKKLRAWWHEGAQSQRSSGTVARLLPHGMAGFIKCSDGAQYYFQLPKKSQPNSIPVGTAVEFELVEGFDKKKNAPSKQAINLRSHIIGQQKRG